MKRMLSLFLSSLIGMSLATAQTEQANDSLLIQEEEAISVSEKPDGLQWLQIATYVTTASKKKELVQGAPANITVITQAQIQEFGVNSLAEVLSFVPGITVIETFFGMTDVIFRGSVSDVYNNKSLMLINGHPTFEGANGSYHLEQIPLNAIKQIEIICGPGSVLYGTNAYTGVVNIITFDGSDVGMNKISAKGGSFNTQEYTLSGGGKKEDFNYFAAASLYDTDGYEFNVKRDMVGQSKTFDYENECENAFVGLQYKEVSLNYSYFNQDKQKLGYIPMVATGGLQHYENYFFDLKWAHAFTEAFSMQVRTNYDRIRKDYDVYNGRGGISYAPLDVGKYGGELQFNYIFSDNFDLTFGGIWSRYALLMGWPNNTRVVYTSVGPVAVYHGEEVQKEKGVYTNFNWKLMEELSFVAGLRYADHSTAGDNLASNAGFIYEVGDKKFIKLLYGEAFRFPNGYETSISIYGMVNGNPDLVAETIKTYSLGLDMLFADRYNLKTTLFYSSTYDCIIRRDSNHDRIAEYLNSEGDKIWGIEADLKVEITSSVNCFINGTVNDGEMKESGLDVAFLPEYTGNAGMNWKIFDPFMLNMSVQYISERKDNDRDYAADSYTLFNMQGVYTINESLKLSVNVTNLFDEEYYYPEIARQEIGDMGNGPGQAFYGKVEYSY